MVGHELPRALEAADVAEFRSERSTLEITSVSKG
jgi:hypothetical protein